MFGLLVYKLLLSSTILWISTMSLYYKTIVSLHFCSFLLWAAKVWKILVTYVIRYMLYVICYMLYQNIYQNIYLKISRGKQGSHKKLGCLMWGQEYSGRLTYDDLESLWVESPFLEQFSRQTASDVWDVGHLLKLNKLLILHLSKGNNTGVCPRGIL